MRAVLVNLVLGDHCDFVSLRSPGEASRVRWATDLIPEPMAVKEPPIDVFKGNDSCDKGDLSDGNIFLDKSDAGASLIETFGAPCCLKTNIRLITAEGGRLTAI